MILEKLVGQKNLPRYRAWKQGLRVGMRNRLLTLSLAAQDKKLNRLFDDDFVPIFICGISGSGTTLMSALLEQNYRVQFSLRESARHPYADRLLWLDKTESYESLARYLEALHKADGASIQRVERATLNLYRRVLSYPKISNLVLDKAPNSHLLRAGKLLAAFPSSNAILIYRDPQEVIEGLRRKWPKPFGNASFEELTDFWNSLHREFLDQSDSFAARRYVYSYAQLVADSEKVIAAIAKNTGLVKRDTPLILKDKENKAGKGLRNVVDGKLVIIKDAARKTRKNLSAEQGAFIREQSKEVYARLEAEANKG